SILRPCQFRRRGCRSSGAKYGGRALDPASSDISSGMERRVIEPRNCKRLQHRTCPQEIWSRAPRLLKRPDGDERTPRRSRLSPSELGLDRLLRLDLGTPRLPVVPQPAREIPRAVLEEPTAQQHRLLLQLGPAPVDEGQQHLPSNLVAETPRVL